MKCLCSVAKKLVYPQTPAHAPRWLNLCAPLLGFPAGCGNPLRNRAMHPHHFQFFIAWEALSGASLKSVTASCP